MAVIFPTVANVFPINQEVAVVQIGKSKVVSQAFTITQSVIANIKPGKAASPIIFNQRANVNRKLTIHQVLNLQQSGARSKVGLATQSLNFVQSVAPHSKNQSASNVLVFTQTLKDPGHNTKQTFAPTQSVIVTKKKLISIAQALVLTGVAHCFKPTILFSAIEGTPSVILHNVYLTFGALSITLPSPEFDNVDTIELMRVNRRSRGGNLIVFRDPIWPKTEILKMKFINVKKAISKALLAFLQASLGKTIALVDYEGTNWSGFILNPDTAIAQEISDDFGGFCGGFTVELEFQGVRV